MGFAHYIVACCCAIPSAAGAAPVWRGEPVTRETLLDAARRAANEEIAPSRWLDSIAHEEVLARFAEVGHDELFDIDRHWRDAWARFLELWKSVHAAELAWRKQ